MGGRRLAGIIVAAIGVIALIGSFVWRSVGVPALVRFPTDLDVTPQYEGTVALYLDPTTYAPLATPQETPLTVKRHIQAVGKESSKERVLVKETLELASPPLFASTTQESQYVMDRRSLQNVADPRTWAYSPDNVVDRSGSYRLNFPFDTKSTNYPVFKNEIGATYEAKPASPPNGEVAGFKTVDFAASQAATAITPAYLAALNKIVKLPNELSLEQLKPILKNAGFDIDVELPKLIPSLSPEDIQAIAALAQKPVQLQYQLAFEGGDAVEPYTGSIVDVKDVVETVTGKPVGDSVTALKALLQKYPNVPAAQTGLAAIAKLDADPIKIFINSYHQTDASVTDIAKTVRDQRDRRRLAESTVPNALLIGGIALVLIGVILAAVPKRSKKTDAAPVAPDNEPA